MTDTEMNEFCARELGWQRFDGVVGGEITEAWMWKNPEGRLRSLPNFLNSEEANALLLEAMHLPTLDRRLDGWHCHAYGISPSVYVIEVDRKRAIVLAFIEWRKHAT